MRAAGLVLNLLGILIGVWAAYEFASLAIRTAWWTFGFAAACAWAGGAVISYAVRKQSAHDPADSMVFQLLSYVLTAAGVMFVLYAGACSVGTIFFMSLMAAPSPQGTPLDALLFGIGAIVAASIIAASLLYSGTQLRQ